MGLLQLAEGRLLQAVKSLARAQEAASSAGRATARTDMGRAGEASVTVAFDAENTVAGTLLGDDAHRVQAARRMLVKFRSNAIAARRMGSILCNQVRNVRGPSVATEVTRRVFLCWRCDLTERGDIAARG